ncbi:MAG: flippase activity-associated protein Agl23 [bacterium]
MRWYFWIVGAVIVVGALLRLPQLELKPMHTDEAVHAIKFGTLLERGIYRYDKDEYHGPTLNYLTLVPAWVLSQKKISEVTETTLRIIPALFGLGIVILLALMHDLGPKPMAFAALLTAVSPAMVYYSRYYIQEMLLVCASLALIFAGYRLLTQKKIIWAVLTGVSVGFMAATKETWLLFCGAMVLALVGTWLLRRREGEISHPISFWNLSIMVLSAAAVIVLFFSSFFSHWQGIKDFLLAYQTYFGRAVQNIRHNHPWYYFFQILLWSKGESGPLWTEAAIIIFGLSGIWHAFRQRSNPPIEARWFWLFLGLYALSMLAISSAIPYKTPWLVVGTLLPFIMMAGYGLSIFFAWLQQKQVQLLAILIITLITGHLGWQAYQSSYRYYDDPVNPYVYSHPTQDVLLISTSVIEAALHTPEGLSTPVQVVFPEDEYWPLPWYLRSMKNVGWWNNVDSDVTPTSIMVITPELENDLLEKIYNQPSRGRSSLYVPLFDRSLYLRPGKEVRGYVTLDLWNSIHKAPVQ